MSRFDDIGVGPWQEKVAFNFEGVGVEIIIKYSYKQEDWRWIVGRAVGREDFLQEDDATPPGPVGEGRRK